MNNIALILEDSETKKIAKFKIINYIMNIINNFSKNIMVNQIENIIINEEQFTIYLIKLPKGLDYDEKIKSISNILIWLQKQRISMVYFDNSYGEFSKFINKSLIETGVNLCEGKNLKFIISIIGLKKLLKSKKLDMKELDVSIISGDNFEWEEEFVRELSTSVKFLTYITKENNNTKKLIDEIFNSCGFPIRICADISKGIKEADLIINFSETNFLFKSVDIKKNSVVFNINRPMQIHKKNISILNDIIIDISSLISLNLPNNAKYAVCETLIEKNYSKELINCKEIYEKFKKCGFKVCGFDGINI